MGWIKLDRQILSHWLWEGEPFSRGQAWVDLLLMANHDGGKAMVGADLADLERGQIRTSLRRLAARWGWSTKKVLRFLARLEAEEMVVQNASRNGNTITIVNYGKFQDCGNAEETLRKHQGNTFGKKETEERETKEKKQKKEKEKEAKKESSQEGKEYISLATQGRESNNAGAREKRFVPPTEQDVAAYVAEKGYTHVDPTLFVAFYASKNWMVGKTKMSDWKAAARGWNSRHGKDSHAPARKREVSFFDLAEEIANGAEI